MSKSVSQTTHQPVDGYNPFNPEFGYSAPSDSVDLIKLIRKSQKLLILGLLVGLLLGILAYLFLGPAYQASTRMLVSLKAAISNDNIGTRTFSDRAGHVHLIKSDFIIERAFEIGDLATLPTLAESGDPIETVIDGLKVNRSSGTDRDYTNVFEISYQSKSQEDSMAVLQAVIAAYNEYLDDNRAENTDEMQSMISSKESSLRAEIDTLEAELMEFRENAPIHWTAPVGQPAPGTTTTPPNYYVARLQDIEKDRRGAFAERAQTQARIQAIEKMQASGESRESLEFFVMHAMTQPAAGQAGAPGAAAGGGMAPTSRKDTLDSDLLAARMTERRLMYNFGEDHERVTKIREKIKLIMQDYQLAGLTPPNLDLDALEDGKLGRADLVSVYLRSLNLKLVELEFRVDELDKLYREAREDAKNAALYEVKNNRLSDAIERKKDQLQIVVNQSNNLDLSKEQTGYTTKQISPIRVELAKKRILKVVGAFGVLGIMAMLAWQYLREWHNTQLRNMDDVHRFARGTVLGSVPDFPPVSAAMHATATQTGLSPALRYYHSPGSPEAESFRSIRTTLFHNDLQKEGRGAVIQISSAEPGDGKSTIAANLATAIAQSGKSVLLIDADLRRPTGHELFGLRGDVGFSDALEGEVDWPAVCQPTGIDRLSFMAAGSATNLPAELLSGSQLSLILDAARREYDFILLDTPPLLAVSDPCIIGPFVDGLVLVVRLYKNKRDQTERSLELLKSHGIPLVGTVVNGADIQEGPYYNYRVDASDRDKKSQKAKSTIVAMM